MSKICLTAEESDALSAAVEQIETIMDGCGDEAHTDYSETLKHLLAMQRRVVLVKYHRAPSLPPARATAETHDLGQ